MNRARHIVAIVLLVALHLCALGAAVLLTGCATTPLQLENTRRLMAHPQFQKAADAAPDFVSDALKTVNRLEQEIERR